MKLRLLSYILAALIAAGPAHAQSQLLLGAGKPSGAAPASCVAFLPANFAASALYISWTTADGLGSFGMACLNGTTAVAASTLGTISGSGSVGASGLVLTGGFFQFTSLTWLTQNSGTIYSNASASSGTGTRVFLTLSDNTTNNEVDIRGVNGSVRGSDTVGGVGTSTTSGFSFSLNVPFKTGYSYTAGTQIIYVNGTITATTAGASTPPSLTAAYIGATAAGVASAPGTYTETAFFSAALNAGTTPTLQAITQ